MTRVLRAVGVFQSKEAGIAAKSLYELGHYANQRHKVSLMCFGREISLTVRKDYPTVNQVIWSDVLRFIYNRFREYRREKSSHQQWDQTGHTLWNASEHSKSVDDFVYQIDIH